MMWTYSRFTMEEAQLYCEEKTPLPPSSFCSLAHSFSLSCLSLSVFPLIRLALNIFIPSVRLFNAVSLYESSDSQSPLVAKSHLLHLFTLSLPPCQLFQLHSRPLKNIFIPPQLHSHPQQARKLDLKSSFPFMYCTNSPSPFCGF